MRRPHNQKPIKISPESPLSGQQGQFALAVLGFVHRTSTARQTPTAHLRTSRNCAMIKLCTSNERTRSLGVANFECIRALDSRSRAMASSAWPLAQPEPHRRRRCRTGGQSGAARIASRPTSAPCMYKAATSRATWAVCPARACACARVCLSRRRACKENRALAHSRTRAIKAHLKTQTTTYPESPPRRAARAVVPVVWVFSCGARTHTTRQRAPHQRRRCRMGGTNGQLAMRADPMAPCRSKEGKRKAGRGVFEPGVCIARTCPPYGARVVACMHQKHRAVLKPVLIGRLRSCEPTRRPLH